MQDSITLKFDGIKDYLANFLLVFLAATLPIVAHIAGAPVRILLPMHWAILLAGLVYGWKGGALTGLLVPVVSHLISGYPLPHILPSMTVELFAYGFLTGTFKEKLKLNAFVSVALAILVGRIIFIGSVFLFKAVEGSYLEYFQIALIPGIFGAVGQILVLPFVAKWWIEKKNNS
ncbi:MAG: hypothetical protein DWQ06_09415 [Calditrichaeota bacterium]|nr:MAG: hypothetical protein DWQ06_09415 [Calditrichota bacterium]